MNDTIQLRAGDKKNMPALADREPGYVRDEKALYIGTPDGNVKLTEALETRVSKLEEAGDAVEARVKALEDKLEAYPAASVAGISPEADLASVIETVNGLISALKEGGMMSK